VGQSRVVPEPTPQIGLLTTGIGWTLSRPLPHTNLRRAPHDRHPVYSSRRLEPSEHDERAVVHMKHNVISWIPAALPRGLLLPSQEAFDLPFTSVAYSLPMLEGSNGNFIANMHITTAHEFNASPCTAPIRRYQQPPNECGDGFPTERSVTRNPAYVSVRAPGICLLGPSTVALAYRLRAIRPCASGRGNPG